ncbi:unnamed protein product, partial [Urochloa humidicola]
REDERRDGDLPVARIAATAWHIPRHRLSPRPGHRHRPRTRWSPPLPPFSDPVSPAATHRQRRSSQPTAASSYISAFLESAGFPRTLPRTAPPPPLDRCILVGEPEVARACRLPWTAAVSPGTPPPPPLDQRRLSTTGTAKKHEGNPSTACVAITWKYFEQ